MTTRGSAKLPGAGGRAAIIDRAAALAENLAAWVIVRMRHSQISMTSTKTNEADFVTDIDLSVEMWVRERVLEQFPRHGFIGEEFGQTDGAEFVWYCDPIDGTTNFACGLPWHSFSLAMVDEDGPVVGVVADPRTGEVFTAVRGRGARLDGSPLEVRKRSGVTGSLFLTELQGAVPWQGMSAMIELLSREHVTSRIMGSSTLSVTGLAAGRGQTCVISDFGPVDLLAGVLIASEAGMVVLDEAGEATLFPTSGGILVTHPGMAARMHELWTVSRSS